jgi:hypothetical protein
MPTTLPVPARDIGGSFQNFAEFAIALVQIYAVIALLAAAVASIESRCGMFRGLTLAQSILMATATDLPSAAEEPAGATRRRSHCSASPCSEMSRPASSSSDELRSGKMTPTNRNKP